MQITTTKAKDPRSILVGMIFNTPFLGAFISDFGNDFFEDYDKGVQILYGWCKKHYEQYGVAPAQLIDDYYDDAVKNKSVPSNTLESLEKTLDDLMADYADGQFNEYNMEYLLDRAHSILTEYKAKKLGTALLENADKGALENIEKLLAENPLHAKRALTEAYNIFSTEAYTSIAEQTSNKPLYMLPGAYGKLISPMMCRGDFVAYIGPEKRGKTFHLCLNIICAMAHGLKVTIITCGDMNKQKYDARLKQMWTHLPITKEGLIAKPKSYLDCKWNQLGECKSRFGRKGGESILNKNGTIIQDKLEWNYAPCTKCQDIRNDVYIPALLTKVTEPPQQLLCDFDHKSYAEKYLKTEMKNPPKLYEFPSGALTPSKLRSILIRDRKEGWVPDVLVVDYIDIMDADSEDKKHDFRNQENKKWAKSRGISQEFDVLYITASQGNANSAVAEVLMEEHIAEDKRKKAHPTGLIGINQNQREKVLGIQRVNRIIWRDGEAHPFCNAILIQDLNTGLVENGSFIDYYKNYKENFLRMKE